MIGPTNSANDTSNTGQNTQKEPTYREIQETLRRDPAFDLILEKLYSHLRAVAANIRKPYRYATKTPTEMVHEAAMKMMNTPSLKWEDEVHFQRIAAVAMKQILIDSARRRKAEIHGGALARVTLSEWLDVAITWDDSMLDLNRALDELGEKHSREAQAVDLRFFGGLTVPETAAALGVSESTAAGDLRFARAFLSSRIAPKPKAEQSLQQTASVPR